MKFRNRLRTESQRKIDAKPALASVVTNLEILDAVLEKLGAVKNRREWGLTGSRVVHIVHQKVQKIYLSGFRSPTICIKSYGFNSFSKIFIWLLILREAREFLGSPGPEIWPIM